jgi:DNA polymerase
MWLADSAKTPTHHNSQSHCSDPSSVLALQYRQAWRNENPETVRFWRSINRAAIMAVNQHGETISCNDRVSFTCDDTFLRMRLPSGRELAYPFPRLIEHRFGEYVVIFMDNQQGKWVECHFGRGAYGGIWTENVVSAAARDVFVAAMPRLEAKGYPIVLHVHDEIVAEVPIGFGSRQEFLQIITESPEWAAGLPIAAKVREGDRFCKVKG